MASDKQKDRKLVLVACVLGTPLVLLGVFAASAMNPTFMTQGRLNELISDYNNQLDKPPAERTYTPALKQISWDSTGSPIVKGKVENSFAYGFIYGGEHRVALTTDDGRTLHGAFVSRGGDFNQFYVTSVEGGIEKGMMKRVQDECIEEALRQAKRSPSIKRVSLTPRSPYSNSLPFLKEDAFLARVQERLQGLGMKVERPYEFKAAKDERRLCCQWQRYQGTVIVECL